MRPQSIFTESSLSLPTNYYDQTTPYADFQGSEFRKYKINNTGEDLMRFDDDEIEEEDDDDVGNETYDAFDDDFGTPGDFIEAFNPNFEVI